jgi:anti-sigma factor RsiW
MNHLTTDVLNDLLDGELPPAMRDAAEAHLAACTACRAEADALRRTIARVRALPQSVPPRRDLRPRGTEARPGVLPLRRGAVPRWAAVLAAAAVLVLALGAAWRLAARAPAAVPAPAAPVAQVERRYEAVVAELAGLLEERRARLPAEVRTDIDQTLAEIDRTLEQSRRALRSSPGDVDAELGLSATYGQKIELLHQALELTATE